MKEVYVVIEYDGSAVLGVFESRADAEEAILTECEDWVYEVLMTGDPADVISSDVSEFDYHYDYYWFLNDAGRSFNIVKTMTFY